MHHTRRPEESAGGAAGERVLLDSQTTRRELALQDLTNLRMIGSTHEARNRELAEQHAVVSHCVRAR
jgi:hypothetical protein